MKERPDRDTVSEYISYDPVTGEFRWKKFAPPTGIVGSSVGYIVNKHLRISLFGRKYPATHIAWLLMTGEWPSVNIDHKNRNGINNEWENLRLATQTQNQKNIGIRSDNTSGYKGVHPYKRGRRSKWVAQLGKQHIGYFQTAEEAALAYDRLAAETFGEFAYLNFPSRLQE